MALACFALARLLSAAAATAPSDPALVTLSIVGTSDLHGAALPNRGAGGLPLLSGYIGNLRAKRASDGAVVLVDSGDTFQGDAESNLSEGAFIVDAYNAMGYTAEALGNHDFDFGSVDSPSARQTAGDPRGAIKARAAQARYPILAANLIDESTGRAVEWTNVRPSALVTAAGVKIGIVGVMTVDALHSTLAANVQGLRVAPLAQAIVAEATKLRTAGAGLVIVAAHAGGRCDRFDDPDDLSSCDDGSEIFRLARDLPSGLVDVIAAGHTHGGLAQRVAGIAIVQPFSKGQAFGRVDVTFNRQTRSVVQTRIWPPQPVCARQDPASGRCAAMDVAGTPATYEGKTVVADPAVIRAMEPKLRRVRELEAMPLGVSLPEGIERQGSWGSPLGNIFADAIRQVVPEADVAAVNNATRGLWADLPAGPLTFGRLYAVFPFDNRVAQATLTGADLSRWLLGELSAGRRSGLGVSGIRVRASCGADGLRVDLMRNGELIHDADRLRIAAIGGPTISGNVASADPLDGGPPENGPVVREAVEDWFRQHGRADSHDIDESVRGRIDGAPAEAAGCAF